MRWVAQKHAHGCGLAVLAMVTGESYDAIRAEIDNERGQSIHGHDGDWETSGISHFTLDRFLIRRGWFMQRVYKGWRLGPWPPKPWAPVHIAQVRQPSGTAHYVLMLADGWVLDPLQAPVSTLDAWADGVMNVAGLLSPSDVRSTGAYKLGMVRPDPETWREAT